MTRGGRVQTKQRMLIALLCAQLSMVTAANDSTATSVGGVWRIKTPISELRTTAGGDPPLRAAALKIYAERQTQRAAGNRSFDTTLRCKPMGLPRTAYDAEAGPFEILVNASVVGFAYTWNRMIRFAYISAAPPDAIGPAYYGTSTARWEGDTLVVSTQGLHSDTLLDASGMPHTDALALIERYRVINSGRELELMLRIDDPATFERPWETRVVYERVPNARIAEDVCTERLGITDY